MPSEAEAARDIPSVLADRGVRLMLGDCRQRLRELADNSVDAVVCDPPYGLSKEPDIAEVLRHWLAGDDYEHASTGFLGNSWDSFVPGPVIWREVLRVLKPGGHALAFAGSRTADLMGIAIRLAGFEIRDTIAYMHGEGMPKSRDVGKALDERHYREFLKANPDERARVSALKRQRRETMAETEAAKAKRRPHVAARLEAKASDIKVQIQALEGEQRRRCGAARAVVGKAQWSQPAKSGHHGGLLGDGITRAHEGRFTPDITAPATPEAQRWDGWGTAMKPSHEPIIVARKPLERGNGVADNVLAHGVAALNIRGCRVSNDGDRWPANAVFAHTPDCRRVVTREAWECARGCPVLALDAQGKGASRFFKVVGPPEDEPSEACSPEDDTDELTYPTPFLYTSKPRPAEKDAGLEAGDDGRRNPHPTVKSIELMRWLCRLVTPTAVESANGQPGIVLDPFMGSGGTGCAAVLEGLRFIGVEMDAEYMQTAERRIAHWAQQGHGPRQDSVPAALALTEGAAPAASPVVETRPASGLRRSRRRARGRHAQKVVS